LISPVLPMAMPTMADLVGLHRSTGDAPHIKSSLRSKLFEMDVFGAD
jgi:hypothetical protein